MTRSRQLARMQGIGGQFAEQKKKELEFVPMKTRFAVGGYIDSYNNDKQSQANLTTTTATTATSNACPAENRHFALLAFSPLMAKVEPRVTINNNPATPVGRRRPGSVPKYNSSLWSSHPSIHPFQKIKNKNFFLPPMS